MNRRMIAYMVGQVLEIIAALMALPLLVSLIYRETSWKAFLITIIGSLLVGILLTVLSRPKDKVIYSKEGFIIVAFSWILLSAIGAVPFVLTKEIPNFIDAFFETASGFTTTGASIVRDVEKMGKGILFWRSFTHWIGGMGIIVFMMAIVPSQNDRNMHVMRAEVPGPTVGKLVPRLRDTARILYLLYIGVSVIEVFFLLAGGMSLYESLVHMFGTAGTGGFGIKADSIAGYSPYLQWTITIFMLIFGINFNLYYLMVHGHIKDALKSTELRVYLCIWLLSTAVITVNILPQVGKVGMALNQAGFQTASILTTTGYATADFNLWPNLSKMILLGLMFIGGCAGSTGGGLKVARVILLFRSVGRELRHLLHPRSVAVVKFEGKTVSDQTMASVTNYFALYCLLLVGCVLLLGFDKMDTEASITAVIACINNIGPGLGAVGPAANYADFSGFSKVVLSFAMLLGRLEIYPLLVAFTPSTWKVRSR